MIGLQKPTSKTVSVLNGLTQFDHVFLGLPRALEHGTSILVTDLIQDEDRTTCPYHLRQLERRAAVTYEIHKDLQPYST